MLNNIRKGANSFVIRILLAMIAFAFVGWGIKDVLQSRNNFDVVSFKSAKNITENDFLRAKSEEITMYQKQTGTNLSEEDIKQLGLEKVVLQRLINDTILNDIADYYNLDLSEGAVISYVKQSPIFKNEKGEFDIGIFKSMFRNSNQNEAVYLQNYKEKLLKGAIISTFLEAFKVPQSMVTNVVSYMAERRFADLVQVDLKTPQKNDEITNISDEKLEEFYKTHKELFTVQEMRNLSYIKADAALVAKKIIITEQGILDFYEENKDEFENKSFDKIKVQLVAAFKQQKADELMIEFAKNLEDDVAAGLTLKEIAEKYEVELVDLKNVTYEKAIDKDSVISVAADAIFEMTEGEVLYPVELQDKSGLILVELSTITPAKLEEFSVVKEKARLLLKDRLIAHANMKNFENLASDYKNNKLSVKELSVLGIKADPKFSISRSQLEEETKLPQGLLFSIFQLKKGETTPVFRLGNKAYFAHVKNISTDDEKLKTINKSAGESISTTIKNSILEELIFYFIKKNNMKVNFKDRVLQ